MRLYYTSVTGQDVVQADPRLSLGGYKSSSVIPNSAFDNFFGEISQFLLSKEIPEDEFIGIIAKNESGVAIENLWLWFEYGETPYSTLSLAAVDLTVGSVGSYMEHIPNRNSKPLYADFYEANGIENAVSLGDVAVDGMLGLWFCRTLIDNLAETIQANEELYQVDPDHPNMVIPVVQAKSDVIKIYFRWGSEYYGGPIGNELI